MHNYRERIHTHVNATPKVVFVLTDMYVSLTISDILTALSPTSSIEWNDYEDILVTGTGVVRSEGVVCLNDIDTVSTGDDCWFICHIVDEDRVPDIMINISHIQREGSTP